MYVEPLFTYVYFWSSAVIVPIKENHYNALWCFRLSNIIVCSVAFNCVAAVWGQPLSCAQRQLHKEMVFCVWCGTFYSAHTIETWSKSFKPSSWVSLDELQIFVWLRFNGIFMSLFQGDGGEAEGQVPSPRVLHLHRLRHQPKTEGTFLCGGPDLLWEARTRASDSARGLRRGHRLPQVERSLSPASDCMPRRDTMPRSVTWQHLAHDTPKDYKTVFSRIMLQYSHW